MAVFSTGERVFEVHRGAVTKALYTAFLERLDADPVNAIVVMDNASIHKRMSLAKDLDIVYTPPYSPEFNAIELCFAKVKGAYRSRHDVDDDDVPGRIQESIASLTSTDIKQCFGHVQTLVSALHVHKDSHTDT